MMMMMMIMTDDTDGQMIHKYVDCDCIWLDLRVTAHMVLYVNLALWGMILEHDMNGAPWSVQKSSLEYVGYRFIDSIH